MRSQCTVARNKQLHTHDRRLTSIRISAGQPNAWPIVWRTNEFDTGAFQRFFDGYQRAHLACWYALHDLHTLQSRCTDPGCT